MRKRPVFSSKGIGEKRPDIAHKQRQDANASITKCVRNAAWGHLRQATLRERPPVTVDGDQLDLRRECVWAQRA